MFDLKLSIPSPTDAVVLAAPDETDFIEKGAKLFQIQAGEQVGPIIIPIAGEMLSVHVRPGQHIKKGELIALIAQNQPSLITEFLNLC